MRKLVLFGVIPVTIAGAMLGILALPIHGRVSVFLLMLVPMAVITALVVTAGFTLPEDYLARWTKAHGVTITDENRPVIHTYLKRGRRIRTVGALSGYVAYTSVMVVIGNDNVGVGWLRAIFGGYLLGAAVAEFWAFHPKPGAPRAASLVPRRITDYVPRYAIVGVLVVSMANVALTAAWPHFPRGVVFPGSPTTRPDLAAMIAWTAAAVMLAMLVFATARQIVLRPQPASSEAMVEADDAIRSTAMHGVVGAGLALVLGILGRNAEQWQHFAPGGPANKWLVPLMVVAGWGSIFAWLRLGIDQPWVVRRAQRQSELAA